MVIAVSACELADRGNLILITSHTNAVVDNALEKNSRAETGLLRENCTYWLSSKSKTIRPFINKPREVRG